MMDFYELCELVRTEFLSEWERNKGDFKGVLELQKRAIIGYEKEVRYFREKIAGILRKDGFENVPYPAWYTSLADAIYQENWGLAGVSEWFGERYRESSSCKLIGSRIYFLAEGHMKLMPQTLTSDRFDQLVRAFLLLTPEERMDKDYHEVYLLDGTRITIFREGLAKKGQDTVVFRRYIVPEYTFEEQASRGTIPEEAIPLFKEMVRAGFNIAFTGPLRSAKTTFLSTWQSYENPLLEGVLVETDPEIPMHKLLPEAPIVQILADGEKLEKVSKNLLRSDADYIILAEARDGIALDLAVRMAGKGTRRMKMTFHLRNPYDFPYDAAWEIMKSYGTDLGETARKVAEGFDYIFSFVLLEDKRRKRLRGIYEIRGGHTAESISIEPVCLYDFYTDSWVFRDWFSEAKRDLASTEAPGSEKRIRTLLKELSGRFPMTEEMVLENKKMNGARPEGGRNDH